MRIVHACLSCFYIDGYSYQENELVRQHVADGHEVLVIASTETYGQDRQLMYVAPSSYMGGEGAKVIRLPYRPSYPHAVARKLRMHPGFYRLLEEAKPEVILFHGLCGWELNAVADYARMNPGTRLYVDSHEDANNSARGLISRYLLHGLYYRPIIRRCLDAFQKVLCISQETMAFVQEVYGVPREMLEFFPLGGTVFNDEEYRTRRRRGRSTYQVRDGEVLLLQTGKMGKQKKVIETLSAFADAPGKHLRMVLAGHLDEEIRSAVIEGMSRDPRVQFIGWKSAEELRDLLCAADVYVQPGTQSVTMQMSLCSRCPVVLDDVPSHHPFLDGNGWLLSRATTLADVFRQIEHHPEQLGPMSEKSLAIARRLLDYKALAARLYH